MCIACGGWPWSQPVHLAAPPVKEEHVFLDSNHDFYPDYRTGIHPPAPIYQSNQPSQPAASMYCYQGTTAQPASYYNGYYYGATAPPANGWQLTPSSYYPYYPYSYFSYTTPSTSLAPYSAYSSYCYPASAYNYSTWSNTYSPYKTAWPYAASSPYYTGAAAMPYAWPSTLGAPWCAQAGQAQAASYLAANAALAAAPQAPYYFVGANAAEIQAQNAYIAANLMQMPQVPSQLVPFKPGSSQQFWVKELDGSWTLREHNDVLMGELGAGHWERHATSGYYYYVRHPG